MNKNSPVYLIFGDDEFPISAKAKELVQSLVPVEEQIWRLEVIDGKADTVEQAVDAVRRCIEALRTMGFLSAGKVVWLRGASFFADNVVGRSEDTKTSVHELADMIRGGLPSGQILVVTAIPKLDKRHVFYKACFQVGEIHEFDVPDKPAQAEKHARENASSEFEKAGLKIGGDVLQAFLEKVGTDTRQIASEVEKLAVYMDSRREVRLEDIDAVVSAAREVAAWDLADAVGERNLARALKVLRQLLFQKESPIGLVIGLEKRMNDLMVFREAMDNGWVRLLDESGWRTVVWNVPPDMDDIYSCLEKGDLRKLHPYRGAKLAMQAVQFTLPELSRCRALTVHAHEQLVSSSVPELLILEMLVLKLLAGERKNTYFRT